MLLKGGQMESVIEFDKQNVAVTIVQPYMLKQKYSDDVLKILYQDGHAIVNNHVEIFFEGCYNANIVLTLEE